MTNPATPVPAVSTLHVATLVWRGPAGATSCRLRASGFCGIFHEDSADVTADELHGLPLRWALLDTDRCRAGTSCAELPCGHTFHVSALALHFVSRDMRCPVCRRGPEGRMYVESLPRCVQDVFRARLDGMEDSSEDSGSESGAVSSTTLVASAEFLASQQQLRLVVELIADDNTVTVFQTPLHCRQHIPFDLSGHDTDAVFHEFYVQRSFSRHVCGRVAGQREHHVSIRFSLSHPFFRMWVGTGAAPASSARSFSLVADPHAWDDDDVQPWPGNVGSVGVDLAEGRVSLALQPHKLVVLWEYGALAQHRTA